MWHQMQPPEEREKMLSLVNWATCPFKKDNIPDGNWRKNHLGNYHLTCADNSYWYINLDGGVYHRDGDDSSVYASPPGERYYTPPQPLLTTGEYFNGFDSVTGREKLYWKDRQGRIELSLRKNLEGSEQREIATRNIAIIKTGAGKERIIEVEDDDGDRGDGESLDEMLGELRRQRVVGGQRRRYSVDGGIERPESPGSEGTPAPAGGDAHIPIELPRNPREEPQLQDERVDPAREEELQPEAQNEEEAEEEAALPSPSQQPRSPKRKYTGSEPEVRTRSMYRRSGWKLTDGKGGELLVRRVSARLSQRII